MSEDVTGVQSERMNVDRDTPGVSRAMVALEHEIKVEPVLRELVKLRASILNGCAYCIDMHSKRARKAGESEQRLYMLAAWHDAPFFSERERAALAFTDAVTLVAETHVPAEVYERAAQLFDSEELAHLIWQIATINVWNRVSIATRASVGNYRAGTDSMEVAMVEVDDLAETNEERSGSPRPCGCPPGSSRFASERR